MPLQIPLPILQPYKLCNRKWNNSLLLVFITIFGNVFSNVHMLHRLGVIVTHLWNKKNRLWAWIIETAAIHSYKALLKLALQYSEIIESQIIQDYHDWFYTYIYVYTTCKLWLLSSLIVSLIRGNPFMAKIYT